MGARQDFEGFAHAMDFQSLGNTVVVGLQWGDEGKGKIVDLLTEHFDVVVRFAGGANAGHTVRIGDEIFALHLIPSGILRPEVINLIGPGVALDLEALLAEIDALRSRDIRIAENLLISDRAHLVMPYHKKQDRLEEARLSPDRKIGTTARGIGPCYADKMLRATAFRMGDLFDPAGFRARLAEVVSDRNRVFTALYSDTESLEADAIAGQWLSYSDRLASHVCDTTAVLHEALTAGRRVLFEGAQGSLLDINHGTFPFVTSSTCTAAGAAAAAGAPPTAIQSYLGVLKAYSTRVGGGPFPTELTDETGDAIRTRGREFGTTTGRPRRCGWFDAFAVRYSVALGGITQAAVMHLDTLSTFPEVRICTGYRYNGRDLRSFPADLRALSSVTPAYETLSGWREDLSVAKAYEELPDAARRYVDRLEATIGVPITLVSIGPARDATLHRAPKLQSCND
ncbi:MAG TPA: adenylosuccinate synthase [Phycisphaerae bacterium]|nr:adenylosuccinate synthase [Phycisphaerae bacterium]